MEFVKKSSFKLESLKRTIQDFADGKHTLSDNNGSGSTSPNVSSGT